jgi:AcrR family transcriptional regulator
MQDIALKKQAKQQRAIATVAAITEAATYILTHDGPAGFTTNKVAEKAGVNIASFYQYYPNKAALLFQLTRMAWERQLARLAPILNDAAAPHAERVRRLVRAFFRVEAEEVVLRRALRAVGVDPAQTDAFQALSSQGAALAKGFFSEAIGDDHGRGLGFSLTFIGLLLTSVAEQATDQTPSEHELMQQADSLSEMLIGHFKIRE